MKYLKSILLFFIMLLVINIVLTILSYFNINNNILNILLGLITAVIPCIYLGKSYKKKDYILPLKLSLIIIVIFSIINLISKDISFNIKTLIYYLLIIIIQFITNFIFIKIKK